MEAGNTANAANSETWVIEQTHTDPRPQTKPGTPRCSVISPDSIRESGTYNYKDRTKEFALPLCLP